MKSRYIGVDGCHAGWFAVGLGRGTKWEIGVFKNIDSLCRYFANARLILIDIPIGLINKGPVERTCDIEARRMLGSRRAPSIFPVPCRGVLYTNSYKKACALNKKLSGRSISKQVWHIIPRIREVDRFIRHTGHRLTHPPIRETHPELCFRAIAGYPMQHGKKTGPGHKERLAILKMAFPHTDDIINESKMRYRQKDVSIDDILDALAVALIAKKGIKNLSSIPKNPKYDSCGLRMEILCATP